MAVIGRHKELETHAMLCVQMQQTGEILPFIFAESVKILNYVLVDVTRPYCHLHPHWDLRHTRRSADAVNAFYEALHEKKPTIYVYTLGDHPRYSALVLVEMNPP